MAVLRFPMNISAVLLAGGESRRMGEDKATLLFHGKPLWQIQLELLRKLDPAEIFVSARTDPAWRPDDVQFVADDSPSRGPLSGLAASLNLMRGTHLLALAIDMPFMSESYLRSLLLSVWKLNLVVAFFRKSTTALNRWSPFTRERRVSIFGTRLPVPISPCKH